jgi:hypothetical protein
MTDPRSNSAGTIRHQGSRIRLQAKPVPGILKPAATATGARRR